MKPHTAHPKGSRGFTLIELLIVIGIIATLAAMLLPAMFAVSQEGRTASAKSLLARIGIALDTYARLYVYYPPDRLPVSAQLYNFQGTKTSGSYDKLPALTAVAYSPECLYYFLCHRFLSDDSPLLNVRGSTESMDTNNNGLPEVVDPGGLLFLYNRPKFPATVAGYYDDGLNPFHNVTTFDLYSVGPDGQTGACAGDLLPFSDKTFADFCTKAVSDVNDGNQADDICNWNK